MGRATPLEAVERTTGDAVTASVVWLHGLGADGNDFAPLVDELTQSAPQGIRFVFPHAPEQAVTVNGGMRMPAWYDIRGLGPGGIDEDEAGLEQARQQVEALLHRERERGVAADRLILAGFSQGAATALYTALHAETPPAGIIALSGWLPAGQGPDTAAGRPPIFQAHGDQDTIVPPELGRQAARALAEAGFAVDWHTYPMEHAVCMPEIQQLDEWLSGLLASG
ncbi:MAG: alpha/beta hydrolase [Halorhodospira sp.]